MVKNEEVDSDWCYQTYSDEKVCMADVKCDWCRFGVQPMESRCLTLDDAKKAKDSGMAACGKSTPNVENTCGD